MDQVEWVACPMNLVTSGEVEESFVTDAIMERSLSSSNACRIGMLSLHSLIYVEYANHTDLLESNAVVDLSSRVEERRTRKEVFFTKNGSQIHAFGTFGKKRRTQLRQYYDQSDRWTNRIKTKVHVLQIGKCVPSPYQRYLPLKRSLPGNITNEKFGLVP
ncbi:hypothetical protein CLF_100771, partial [Clonorchis sinensis]